MFEIARILAARHDLETTLSGLLSCVTDTLEAAETAILFLYDQSHDCLTVCDARGYDLEVLRGIRVASGEGMSGRALCTGRIGVYTTAEQIANARANLTLANRELFRQATTTLKEPCSAVCVPMIAGQTKVGALVIESRSRSGHFTRSDMPFLEAVTEFMVLSIDNARLRAELDKTQAREETDHLKAELISTVAHEMRTPLTSIKGYSTALLIDEISFGPETQREFLQIIDSECDVLTDLIHGLLESSVIDAGLLKLELEPVILPRLIASVVNDLARQAKKHRIVVDFPQAFPIVDADPRRITQVLRNLLDNAVKYSPQGGMIVIRGQVQDAQVVVSIADQGVGIAPEHLNRLFEKFFRIESGVGRHVVGSGLGLPIALDIVESHGGRVWAESKLGEGSTFYFTLPLPAAEEQADE
jgi:signal transduction histidine kinase